MALLTTPGWLENAGEIHSAAEMRSYIGGLLAGTRSTGTDLVPLGGVHPGMGSEFTVAQTGSPSMAVTIASGVAWIPGSESSTQGAYGVLNDGTVTVAVADAHVSLPRLDLVVVQIRDSDYSGANDDALISVITGTPDSSPVLPSAPDNSIALAQVAVGAGVSSISNTNITQIRRYLAATGGIIVHDNESSLWTSSNIYTGQLQYARDTFKLFIWDGTSNKVIWDQAIAGADRLPRGIMANPTVTSTAGTTTSGTNEVRDAVLGNYVFTSEGTSRQYEVVFICPAFTSDNGTRVLIKIRDGLGSTPTTSSTQLVEKFEISAPAGVSGRHGTEVIGTFTAASGTHTLSVFWQGYDGGAVTPTSTRQLYVRDIGKVYS